MSENVMSRTRWVPWSYSMGEATLTCELKRQNALEGAAFKSNLADAFAVIRDFITVQLEAAMLGRPATGATSDEVAAHNEKASGLYARAMKEEARFFAALNPVLVRQVFTDCVRNVAGLEIDFLPITTGAALCEAADQALLQAVLLELRRLTDLSAKEAKSSGSPSTSDSGVSEPPSTDSPAPSTEPEVLPTLSTATESLAVTA